MNTDPTIEQDVEELESMPDVQPAKDISFRQAVWSPDTTSASGTPESKKDMVRKLHALLEQQMFMTEVLQQLQATDNLPSTINQIISLLGKHCQASAVTIFENSFDGKFVSNTFEWCDEGVVPTIDRFQDVAYEQFPTARLQFNKDKIICANNFDDLPPEIKAIFPYNKHTAILFIRMEHGGEEMGFVNVNRTSGIDWTESEIVFIRKVVGVLATAILRNRLEDEIRVRTTELYKSETKFRTIVQQLSDLIIVIDAEGIIRYISPAGVRMLGYQPEEMLNISVFNYVHPGDMEYAVIEMEKTLQEDIPEDVLPDLICLRVIDAQGEIVILEGVGRNAFANEAIKGLILTFRNVTQQRTAEQKIQENLEQQQLLSRILQELQYTSDVNASLHQIVPWIAEYTHFCSVMLIHWPSANQQLSRQITWQSSALPAGFDCGFSMPADVFIQWAEYIKTDSALVYDYNHLPAFVKPYYTNNSVKRLYAFPFSQYGMTLGMMVLTQSSLRRQITEWGYDEISFMQSIARIISNALEKETAQENLIKAKEHAEEADKLKSAFLANMSHEIRTPMNGIMGFASLLQRETTSPKGTQFAQIINDNCQMLLQLLDDIIDISKLESKQLKINPVKCNINQLLDDQLLLYRQLLKKKGKEKIEIILDDTTLDETVTVDPVRLQQVLTNLVSNAIKFTDKGFINLGYTKPDDHHLLFYVKDMGVGIPSTHLNIIFERFRQVEEHNTRNIGGTGIGLAISKSLVEMMGGSIWAESEIDVGSTFYFTIGI